MDYFNKYQKYKHKYLQLRTQIGGVHVYKIESINGNKIIIKLISSQERNSYILFLDDNKIKIIYNNNNMSITIYLSNVIISDLVLDFSNVRIIDKLTITYDKFYDTYENIEITKSIIEIFNFDIIEENSVFDTCINFNKRFKYNDDLFGFKNSISNTICNILFLRYNNSEITKYKNILLFIYEVMYFDMLHKINDENYKKYLNKLIKKTIPVYISPKFIKIKNKDCVFTQLSEIKGHVWSIIIDTGNASYTKISTRLAEEILLCHQYKTDDVCINVFGVSGKLKCNKMIKFEIIFYDKIYEILAIIDKTKNNKTDILFGHKCAVDMFFNDNFSFDKDYMENELEYKYVNENAYVLFINDVDKLITKIYEKYFIESLSKLKDDFFNDDIIDDYFIDIFLLICNYNVNNKHLLKVISKENIKTSFDRYEKIYFDEIADIKVNIYKYIFSQLKILHNLEVPDKNANFYKTYIYTNQKKFIESHYKVLILRQKICDALSLSNNIRGKSLRYIIKRIID